MKAFALVVALVIVFTLAIMNVPARAVTMLLSGAPVQLSGLTGTALNGEAARAIANSPAGPIHLGRLSWSVNPFTLLTLSPKLDLESEWGRQRFSTRAGVGTDSTSLSDVDASLPAALIRQLLPIALDGMLKLQLERFSLVDGVATEAQGRLVWESAAWLTNTGARPLGTYVAELSSSEQGAISADILTLSGSVVIEGSAQFQGDRYELDLKLSGDGTPLDRELSQALSLLASPEGEAFRMKLSGSLGAS
ncbi:MAG: type II secretion system protein N [Pseudomonadota bacterium]